MHTTYITTIQIWPTKALLLSEERRTRWNCPGLSSPKSCRLRCKAEQVTQADRNRQNFRLVWPLRIQIILYLNPGVCKKLSIKFGATMVKKDVGFLNFCYRVSIPFESMFHTRITNNEYVSIFCLREIRNTTAIKFFPPLRKKWI